MIIDGYLTIPEVAQLLGVHASRVRHDLRAERLRATRAGRDWFVAADEFARYRDARGTRGRPRTRAEEPTG